MAEQKQEKKKPISVREILRWILCGLLGLLLIAAVTIRAPGKIVALLIVLLLACAALPRRARKWFGLSTAAAGIVLIIWVFLPEDDEGWRPYTFDEELAALQAKYAIPDEENAALVYDELFKTMNGDPNEPKFFIKSTPSSRDEPWRADDHPETADWLKGQQNTIDKLLQAAKKDKCCFPLIAKDSVTLAEYMKNLPKMRQCTFLLLSAANNDIAEGRIDNAVEKYLCAIKMANHLYQQPSMYQYLFGIAIESLILQQFNRFLIEGGPNKEQIELIGNSIKDVENNWSTDWRRMLDFQKLYAKNYLCSLFYEVNPKVKTRLNRGRLTVIDQQFIKKIPPETYCQRKLAKAGTLLGWLFIPSSPQKAGKIIDKSHEKYYAMAHPNYDWSKQPSDSHTLRKVNYRYMVDMLTAIPESAYYRVHEIYLKGLTFRRGSRLLLAIKQYQIKNDHWPENLDVIKSTAPAEAFIDPATEKEFKYENHGQRFSLYGEAINIWPR